jgi:CheY-like chemotaxis protein
MSASDRRVSPRAAVVGSAIVLAKERYVGTYVLENLSASGALLIGDTQLSVDDRVRLLLQPYGCARRFALEASVIRHAWRGPQSVFAAQFVHVPPASQDALQSAVVHHLANRPADGAVLIVDAGKADASLLQRDVQDLGFEAAVAHSELDAIIWLQPPDRLVTAVIADVALPSIDGLALLDFIAIEYPKVRRILACSPDFARMHRDALASGRPHTLLEKPCSRDSLLRALGTSP